MKVFVLIHVYFYDSFVIVGVYKNKQSAETVCAALNHAESMHTGIEEYIVYEEEVLET